MKTIERKNLVSYDDVWYRQWYLGLKKIWWFVGDEKEPEPRSLCGFAWAILLYSVMTFSLGIPLILGWLSLKFNRWFYTKLAENKWVSGYFTKLDDLFGYGRRIEDMSNGISSGSKSPGLTLLGSFVFWWINAFILLAILFGFGCGIWWVITNIFLIPGLIWKRILYLLYVFLVLGYATFLIFSAIGWFMEVIKWLFYIIGHYLYVLGVLIIANLAGIGFVLGCIVLGCLITYCIISVVMSEKMAGFREFFVFKFNGFMAVRKAMKDRPRPKKLEKVKKSKKPRNPLEIGLKLEGVGIKFIGTLGFVWEVMKGYYTNSCPLITFIPRPNPSEFSQPTEPSVTKEHGLKDSISKKPESPDETETLDIGSSELDDTAVAESVLEPEEKSESPESEKPQKPEILQDETPKDEKKEE